ncbi:MAG: hypothetical protein HYY95_03865 [Candidatus Rokubacteria bacterium]|nr:hypothetical protein [Candidatus Rokubacteria bacterium]
MVEDAWRGRGLGVTLLGDNHRMLGLLTRHTNVRERRIESGVVTLILGCKAA